MPPKPTRPSGKVRSLTVRPIQSADLAFEMPGMISFQDFDKAKLGERINKCDLESEIYGVLNEADHSNGLLKYGAEDILDKLKGFVLFTLNNRTLRAALKQSILVRANAYLEKYSKTKEIEDFYKEIYANTDESKNKIKRLESLRQSHEDKIAELVKKYNELAKKVIVDARSTVKITPLATKTSQQVISVSPNQHTVQATTSTPKIMNDGVWKNLAKNSPAVPPSPDEPVIDVKDLADPKNATLLSQETTTDLVDFKYPLKDEEIALQRIQLEIQDELLKHQLINLKVQNLNQIMNNELQQLELDTTKLQNAFLQTLLISPISGIITAIYKDVGETVSAGEPVIRVENDQELLIVGFIQYRGSLKLQQEVTLATKIFETNETKEITGRLVAIRGHDADDDEWDVIIRCPNVNKPEEPEDPQSPKNRFFPINYHFDKDTTELYIHPAS
ncbi:MAG: HlyD family efflux transporter periplasmic adaptor subunit [Leptolyngbyaceae cyanobacterium bins.302]|nr:HlyD family efflux transporter periplasmic adaptor subunit [Leptolyngbyaceae cyanobacterium bins.302]